MLGGCGCCAQLTIKYSWEGTGQRDLDTNTIAFGESAGWSCGSGGAYVQWITGDDTRANSFEQVDIRVDDAKQNGLWTTSYDIQAFAGWYKPAQGSGGATLKVSYRGKEKSQSISPGTQCRCACTSVAVVRVYDSPQPDGSYFEILAGNGGSCPDGCGGGGSGGNSGFGSMAFAAVGPNGTDVFIG